MVKRYDPDILRDIPQSDGAFVLYEDYEKLLDVMKVHAGDICSISNEADRFIADNAELETKITKLKKRLGEIHDEIRNLHAK